jgi:hypothetical protein
MTDRELLLEELRPVAFAIAIGCWEASSKPRTWSKRRF